MAFASRFGGLQRVFNSRSATLPSLYNAARSMSSQIFVGGLSWAVDENQLRDSFQAYGDVLEARVINDRETGRSRGFGFVTYGTEEEAQNAVQGMDGKELHGRVVGVKIAQERPSFGGEGGQRGGYNNDNSGYGNAGGGY